MSKEEDELMELCNPDLDQDTIRSELKEKKVVGSLTPTDSDWPEESVTDREHSREQHWNKIPDYSENEQPSREDIIACEKVLKYAATCNYIQFDKLDALRTMEETTNILKWNFKYEL